jgi:hypothetical protein
VPSQPGRAFTTLRRSAELCQGARLPGEELAAVLARVLREAKQPLLPQRRLQFPVLQCPCGGRRSIRSLHSTRKQAEARLIELGVALPSRVLPPATAPPQLLLAM